MSKKRVLALGVILFVCLWFQPHAGAIQLTPKINEQILSIVQEKIRKGFIQFEQNIDKELRGKEAFRSVERVSNALTFAVLGHYRVISDAQELRERIRRAEKRLFQFLPTQEGMTADHMAFWYGRDPHIQFNDESKFIFDLLYGDWLADEIARPGITQEHVWNAFIQAFLYEMDPHSKLVHVKSDSNYKVLKEGVGEGLGISVQPHEKGLEVIEVVPGSPIERAGVRVGECILSIESEDRRTSVENATFAEMVSNMGGSLGKRLTMEVQSLDRDVRRIQVVREKYSIEFVRPQSLEEGLLVLKIFRFGKGMAEQFKQAIENGKQNGMNRLVIDLRGNQGGLVSEARQLVDHLIDRGLVYSLWTGRGQPIGQEEWYATEPGTLTDVPLVILVNESSASASELVTQTLSSSDHGRALVVGSTTYGKGSAYGDLSLDENYVLGLTSAMYYTKSGRSVQYLGVDPDIYVQDRETERILARRRKLVREGRKIRGLTERDEEFSLPVPAPLTESLLREITSVDTHNPVKSVIAWLEAGELQGVENTGDPALEVASRVLRRWASRCAGYQLNTCRNTGPEIARAEKP